MRLLILIAVILCAAAVHARMELLPNDRIHVAPDGEHLVVVTDGKAVLAHRDAPDVPLWTVESFPATGLVSWSEGPGAMAVLVQHGGQAPEEVYQQIPFPADATDLLLIGNDSRYAVYIRKWFGKLYNHFEVMFVGDRATVQHMAVTEPIDYTRTTDPFVANLEGWRTDGNFFPWVRLYDDNRLWLHITRQDGTAETIVYDLLTAELLQHDISPPRRGISLRGLWDAYGTYALLGLIALLVPLCIVRRRRNPQAAT